MWPLEYFSERLFKVDSGEGEDGGDGAEGSPPVPDGRVSLARRSYYVDVPHVPQAFTWDCGLACVLMVLRTLGIDCCDGIADLEKLCRTTSIWTVDLAYLLNKFSVCFSFFTVTLGANPQYSAETFYREQLQEDIDRVDELFGKALEAGISIQCRSISAYDIAFLLLSGHCIAIALVDKTKLNSSWVNLQDMQQFSEDSDYMGHYVVICGYDSDTCEFEIRDPASSRRRERVSMKSLDQARKSFGTDEDIILVSLTGKNGMKLSRKLLVGSF
uniref:Guanylyl cyclase n=1 Tax=Leersia perrieri TaxID=77586 RepID=A0A0D9WH75_9ORYZ